MQTAFHICKQLLYFSPNVLTIIFTLQKCNFISSYSLWNAWKSLTTKITVLKIDYSKDCQNLVLKFRTCSFKIVFLAQFSTDFNNLGLKIQFGVCFIQNRRHSAFFVVVVCLVYGDGVSSLDARVMTHFNRTRLERCGEDLNPLSLGYTCDFIPKLVSIHRKSFSARQLEGGCRGSRLSVICARRCKKV